jgi:hypothetical protein
MRKIFILILYNIMLHNKTSTSRVDLLGKIRRLLLKERKALIHGRILSRAPKNQLAGRTLRVE